MKTTGLRLFAALVCIQVVILVAYYIYVRKYSLKKGNRISIIKELESQTHPRQYVYSNITSSVQMNKSAVVVDNLTRYTWFKNIRTQCSQLKFSFVSHITQPNVDNSNKNMFLLVLITSGVAKSYMTRRNSVRETWGNEAKQAAKDWKRVFVLGRTQAIEIQQEASAFNDILVLNMTDNYNNLVIKVFSGLLWSVLHVNPRFILKADDDVYVRIPYLISWLENHGSDKFYGGHIIPEGMRVNRSATWKNQVLKDCLAEDYYPAYCSGPFYVLSSRILPAIFQSVQKWTAFPAEDAYLAILARENGIKPLSITGFELRKLADYGTCNWASAIALGHGFDLLELLFIEKRLQGTSELPRDYYKCLVNDWAVIIFLILFPSILSLFVCAFVKLRFWQRFVLQVT